MARGTPTNRPPGEIRSCATKSSASLLPALLTIMMAGGLAAGPASAARFQTIYSFPTNADGRDPSGDLAVDPRGWLYGTTERGGRICPDASYTCGGTVYRLRPPATSGGSWQHNVLHSFSGGSGGATPRGGIIWGPGGVLSGATHYGGALACPYETRGWGCGAVFQLYPPGGGQTRWTKQVLHRFNGERDGRFPDARLAQGRDGTLFGSTAQGGANNNGMTFTITFPESAGASGKQARSPDYTVGWHLPAPPKPGDPGPLTENSRSPEVGDFFGIAMTGGIGCSISASGCGAIFELHVSIGRRAGSKYVTEYSTLHQFRGGSDGAFPSGELTVGPDGSLYGVTSMGGSSCPNDTARGCGVVYRLVPPPGGAGPWSRQILYRFRGGMDGALPRGKLALDGNGALYGVTREGGGCSFTADGCGTVFKLEPPIPPDTRWKRTILHRFQTGAFPNGSVLLSGGAIYGVTTRSVYKITP
jgi:hypothetical protein